jgi:hypothetical protein
VRQALRARAALAAERVVAAGVEDHDVDAAARRRHAAEHEAEVDAGDRNLVFAADLGVDRDQVVAVAQLQPVTGVVQRRDGVLAQAVAELAQRVDERAAVEVLLAARR